MIREVSSADSLTRRFWPFWPLPGPCPNNSGSPCVGIRAVPVGEAMLATTIADHCLRYF